MHEIQTCQACAQRFNSVFCKAREEFVNQINEQKICNVYRKGQVLFNEGSYPFGVYCINEGKIKLSHSGDDGKEQIIRLLRAGDVLGYRALLSGERYSASAVALEDTQVCFIPKELFVHALKHDAGLSFEMMKRLSDELHRAEIKLTNLAQKPIRERLAETLLFIKETYGFEEDGQTLNVRLSREEIANLVGTATESAIRLLSEFKKDGMVDLDGKKIKILKPKELLRTANVQD
ncbi:MAG TPA: Crp/Fnr family transcriptional regulator [Sediminibacterium sp.]|nr:Crp/Fnr family transcriptional regulator [Sediminibacterium sp.]